MRLLVLYHAGFTYTPMILHYLESMRNHSAHEVEYFNVDSRYGEGLDFSAYDAVFVNFCVVSVARVPEPPKFLPRLVAALHAYRGVKIASVQDEYDFTNAVKRFFRQIGVDIILTNVPQEAVRTIYHETAFGHVRFETVQTAYLADEVLLDPEHLLPLAERPIALGYRGRVLPYRLGDVGWHKSEVGYQFQAACANRGLACDIACDEESRFIGDAWIDFVRRCRVMLGTQSGANVFDFDGDLHRRLTAIHKGDPVNFSYAKVRDEVSAHAVDFDMGQVSARIFEAAASRTALALVRGSYSGVIEPDEHYVPIEPDYSNVDQVIDRILDLDAMQAMADRTYTHVVGNPANRYQGLVARVDGLIERAASAKMPARPGCSHLAVTAAPLGGDPYLMERVTDLRAELRSLVAQFSEFLQLAAKQQVEVMIHPDGTYRVLRTASAQAG